MNTRLLRKVAKHILAEPKRLRMEELFTPMCGLPENLRPPCGTTACIAGWGIALSKLNDGTDGNYPMVKGRIVGLGNPEVDALFDVPNESLFYAHRWPEKLAQRYYSAKTPRGRASAAAAAIDLYIKTKGEWRA